MKTDKGLRSEYGLKNASEVWKATEKLRTYRQEARRLLSLSEDERADDVQKILRKLAKLGIMKKGELDDILSLSVRDVLERRLQTIVFRKGLAKTALQSRQLITHGFVAVDGKKVNIPGYLVLAEEEAKISFAKQIDLNAGEISAEKPAPAAKPAAAPVAKVEGGTNG